MSFEQKLFDKHKITTEDLEETKKEYFIQSNFRIEAEQKTIQYYKGTLQSFFKKKKNIIQKNEDKLKELDFNNSLIDKNFRECLNEKFMFNKFQNKRAFTDNQKQSQKLIQQNQQKKYLYYYIVGSSALVLALASMKRYRKAYILVLLPQIVSFGLVFNYLQEFSNINQYFYAIPKLPEEEWEAEKMNIYSECLHFSKEPLLKLMTNQRIY